MVGALVGAKLVLMGVEVLGSLVGALEGTADGNRVVVVGRVVAPVEPPPHAQHAMSAEMPSESANVENDPKNQLGPKSPVLVHHISAAYDAQPSPSRSVQPRGISAHCMMGNAIQTCMFKLRYADSKYLDYQFFKAMQHKHACFIERLLTVRF